MRTTTFLDADYRAKLDEVKNKFFAVVDIEDYGMYTKTGRDTFKFAVYILESLEKIGRANLFLKDFGKPLISTEIYYKTMRYILEGRELTEEDLKLYFYTSVHIYQVMKPLIYFIDDVCITPNWDIDRYLLNLLNAEDEDEYSRCIFSLMEKEISYNEFRERVKGIKIKPE